ncbi:MAG: glycosyltransferase [Campylobacterota bacterium]
MNTPIVIFIFKRYDTVLRILDVVRQVEPKDIFLIADGPRESVDGEKELCLQTREIIENAIDWDCKIHKRYSEKNLGGPWNMINGISWVFENTDRAIFLEDDDLPSKSFLYFANEMLEKYKNNQNIFAILSGDKNIGVSEKQPGSYHFNSHIVSMLGFATWKRTWNSFDPNIKEWNNIATRERIQKRFSFIKRFKIIESFLNKLKNGEIKGWDWDFVFYYNFYKSHNSYCIVPNKCLVENIGIRSDATRTKFKNPFVHLPKAEELSFPLEHPNAIKIVHNSDKLVYMRKYSLKIKVLSYIYKLIMKVKL